MAQPGHDDGAADRSERGGAAGVEATAPNASLAGSAQSTDPGECSDGGARQTTPRLRPLA
ncbi:hypothetical protein [Halorubrum kocurii]|uniref:hypothetical protein n=1 Tax=Halorubrum kocurii TaxID=478441 RepID=UPI00126952EB|nr:hypothetical protein [Halorubrum kocurii]